MDLQTLRKRLQAAGLTQRALGERLGKTDSQVSRLLSGDTAMRVNTLRKIEAVLADAEQARRRAGVAETHATFERSPVRFATLEEARTIGPAPPLSPEEAERWRRDLLALGEAGKRLKPITDMSDDEILGYDEME